MLAFAGAAFLGAAAVEAMIIFCPARILRGSDIPLRLHIAETLVPCFLAMTPRVSPLFISYVISPFAAALF